MPKSGASAGSPAADLAIIDMAWEQRNPSIFTNYYFRSGAGYSAHPGSVRHAQYMKTWDSLGRPPSFIAESGEVRFEVVPQMELDGRIHVIDQGNGYGKVVEDQVIFQEKRGWIFLPWQLELFRAKQEQRTIIGLTGTGKTASIGLLAMFMCATIPNFRFLNVAPTLYQSGLMVRSVQERLNGSLFAQRFMLPGRKGFRESPWNMFRFTNGSTAEFMNIESQAVNVQSWWGDWVNVDEAGLLNSVDETGQTALAGILIGLGTRMRGERPDGKPRLGWMSLISMAYDCDTLWELYDQGLVPENKNTYFSSLVLHRDNPYLTPKDIARIKRLVPPGQEAQWLRGERPSKKGAEFSSQLLDSLFSQQQMDDAQKNGAIIETTRPGITLYQEPFVKNHIYLMAGDPGMGEPPYRNAPVIMVFDVTEFPKSRARMVGFWWGYANGSIVPFLSQFEQWSGYYRVPMGFRGYDSTGPQRYMAEWAAQMGEGTVVPLGFEGSKKWEYLNSAKILMSKGLIQIPAGISGIENQMRGYRLPDKKIAQDIVSTLCLASSLMFPLYRDAYPEEQDDQQVESNARLMAEISSRSYRPDADRFTQRW